MKKNLKILAMFFILGFMLLVSFSCSKRSSKVTQASSETKIQTLEALNKKDVATVLRLTEDSEDVDMKYYRASALAIKAHVDVYTLFPVLEMKVFGEPLISFSNSNKQENPYSKFFASMPTSSTIPSSTVAASTPNNESTSNETDTDNSIENGKTNVDSEQSKRDKMNKTFLDVLWEIYDKTAMLGKIPPLADEDHKIIFEALEILKSIPPDREMKAKFLELTLATVGVLNFFNAAIPPQEITSAVDIICKIKIDVVKLRAPELYRYSVYIFDALAAIKNKDKDIAKKYAESSKKAENISLDEINKQVEYSINSLQVSKRVYCRVQEIVKEQNHKEEEIFNEFEACMLIADHDEEFKKSFCASFALRNDRTSYQDSYIEQYLLNTVFPTKPGDNIYHNTFNAFELKQLPLVTGKYKADEKDVYCGLAHIYTYQGVCIHFTKDSAIVYKNDKVLLEGELLKSETKKKFENLTYYQDKIKTRGKSFFIKQWKATNVPKETDSPEKNIEVFLGDEWAYQGKEHISLNDPLKFFRLWYDYEHIDDPMFGKKSRICFTWTEPGSLHTLSKEASYLCNTDVYQGTISSDQDKKSETDKEDKKEDKNKESSK